jgi:DNA-binding GntR family transcriptional regulator
MPLAIERATPATFRHQIANHFRQSVLTGALKPGERIVERDLTAQLGTSLTAVREAIIQLEGEGLITKRPNAATFVTRIAAGDIAKIFDVRRVLEGLAFDQAARRATTQQIKKIGELHQEAIRAAKAGQSQRYIESDLAWHQAVWTAGDNEYLAGALRKLVLPLFGFSAIRMASQKAFDLLQDIESHKSLMEAIRAQDPVRALQACPSPWIFGRHKHSRMRKPWTRQGRRRSSQRAYCDV